MKLSVWARPKHLRADEDPEHQLEHDDRRREAPRHHRDGDRRQRGDEDDDEERARCRRGSAVRSGAILRPAG